MSRLRILYCTDDPNYQGGAGTALLAQMEAQRRRGNEVAVCFDHVPEHYRLFRPDLVHFHTVVVSLGLGVLEWAQWQGVPHCLTLHDFWPFCGNRMALRTIFDEGRGVPCPVACDGQCEQGQADPHVREVVNGTPTICNQHLQADRMRRNGVRADAVIPCGLDTEFWSSAEGLRPEPARVFSSSAWFDWHWKGGPLMRRAFAETGVAVHQIRDVPRWAVRDALRTGQIFLFPSSYPETWGLSLLEAMACGLACVASRVDGPLVMIEDGEDGMLVPPRDEAALREATLALLVDQGRRQRLGRRAVEKVREMWPLEKLGERHARFYERILDGEVA